MKRKSGRLNLRLVAIFSMTVAATALCITPTWAQQPSEAAAEGAAADGTKVPRLVQFSGVLKDVPGGQAAGLTFALYKDQQGGAPVWVETQNVLPDESGRYTVQLGATTSTGLPLELFTSGEARWLGVQRDGQAEQPRVLLLSVPYAMKAADAETVGGMPPSAFMLAGTAAPRADPKSDLAIETGSVGLASLGGTGTLDFIPLWTPNGSTLGNSILFQSTSSDIGVGTQTPAAKLDVNGGSTVRGAFLLPAKSAATASAGADSEPLNLGASAFNSGTSAAVNQTFRWQAEPAGNDTASPSGTLNLLFGSGTNAPTETGLHIGSNGLLTFAPKQTFPGTGAGTITGVTAGTDLKGGGTSGNVTLNLDTSKVPLLNAFNSFSNAQSFRTSSSTPLLQIFQSGTGAGMSVVAEGNDGIDISSVAPGKSAISALATGSEGTAITAGSSNGSAISASSNSGFAITAVSGGVGVSATTTGTSGPALFARATNSGVAAIQASTVNGPTALLQGGPVDIFPGSFNSGFLLLVDANNQQGEVIQGPVSGVGAGLDLQTQGSGGSQWELLATGNSSAQGTGKLNIRNVTTGQDVFTIASNGDVGLGITNPTVPFEMNADALIGGQAEMGSELVLTDATVLGNSRLQGNLVVQGNLQVSGSKSSVMPVDEGRRQVALYAVEAPENWFEDYGSGRLSGGAATITLEPEFAQTVNSGMEYHVFLTPEGDCEGLYVANKTAEGFEVHELRAGRSDIAFDYRIIARRKGYENLRLADVTAELEHARAQFHKADPPATQSAKTGQVAP